MLINCKECNNKVSNKAISCPNCGNTINKTPNQKEGCFLRTLNLGCGIFVFSFIAYVLYMVVYLYIRTEIVPK